MAINIYDFKVKSRVNERFAYIPSEFIRGKINYQRNLFNFLYRDDGNLVWPEWINDICFHIQDGLTDDIISKLDYLEALSPIPLFSQRFVDCFDKDLNTVVIFKEIKAISQRGEGREHVFFMAKILKTDSFFTTEDLNEKSNTQSMEVFKEEDSSSFLIARELNSARCYCYFASKTMIDLCKKRSMLIGFETATSR
ncbi:MAG: hypothetical protein K2Q15_14695 [Burkholderiales bacterium]|nr:hypothetical protein [Burkholderiales bacterium]